ncbi:MAG TPA: tripartite tricarboxylate transporter substrate binding protein [Falsiroseomonas sp.]|jgi:tripartite-type tricarboxylate transporter receptor subunit TctC|nr:tripartite tricarboxylate transporter substrate binding protein [Falsiroseomonas sp.]
MLTIPRRRLLAATGAAALPAGLARAQGAGFPSQTLRLVVPFAPGGATDIVARLIQPGMQENLNQTVVVENRGGAAGVIGSEAVLNAPPDGHTFIIYTMTNAILAAGLYRNPRIDPRRDFQPVSLVARLPMVLTVGKHVPANTLDELVKLMRERPGRLTYGSAGIGSLNHFGGHMLTSLTNTQATHVPYRGSGPVYADMIAGNVDMMIEGIASQVGYIRNGQVRAIATLAPERNPQLPDVPTAVEQGMPDFNIINFMAIFAPAGVPAPAVKRLEQAVRAAVHKEEINRRLQDAGTDPAGTTVEEFRAWYQAQLALWLPLVESSGIKLD